MRLLVLGGGAQGSAAAFDLLRADGVESVVIADLDVSRPAPFLEPHVGERLELRTFDARRPSDLRSLLGGVDACLCALPYRFGYEMAEQAVAAEVHYCDLGGNTEIVERQRALHAEAVSKDLSVIPDCGLAPGMVNILAQAGIDRLEEVHAVRMLVGGLPRHPRPPLNYQVVYSLEGVLDYYTTPSVVLEGGELGERDALSEVERVEFGDPVGELEAFHTAGGVSTMPERYLGQISRMEYKTLRYPGHAELMLAMRSLGLLSLEPVQVDGCSVVPRQLFIEAVRPQLLDPEGEDLVALRVEVAGRLGGAARVLRFEVLDFYDRENGITAMMRTTGYSLALTALMQLGGQISRKGVHTPDECVPAEPYIRGLAERGVIVRSSEGP